MVDLKKDPAYNDDSQPSVTSATQALKLADEMAGVTAREASIPAPADAIDMAYRKAVADVDADQVGQEVAALQTSGAPAEGIDVEAMGEGRDADAARTLANTTANTGAVTTTATATTADTDDTGTGPYEGRTLTQLRAAARAKGLPASGNKDELVERLRA